jgi:predicted molibdopterin-dependent oxidoreductase YjgC
MLTLPEMRHYVFGTFKGAEKHNGKTDNRQQRSYVQEGTTLLNAAKPVGISSPNLCYLKILTKSVLPHLRCGNRVFAPSFRRHNTGVEKKAWISHKQRARSVRHGKYNIEMILFAAQLHCPTCLEAELSLQKRRTPKHILPRLRYQVDEINWDMSFPLIRDN